MSEPTPSQPAKPAPSSDSQATAAPAVPSDWRLVRRAWSFLYADRRWFWVIAIMTPLGVLANIAQPYLLKVGIDDYIAKGDIDGLGLVALAFAGVVIAGWLTSSLGFYTLQFVSLRGLVRIRRAIFVHVMGQGARFFDRRTTGSLMTRTVNDVDAIDESLARGGIELLTDLLTIVGMLIAMFILDWRLTLVTFAFSPLIWLVVAWFRRRLRPLSLIIRKTLSRLNGFFAEQIYGMSLTQLYGAEPKSRKRFDAMSRKYMDAYHKSNWLDAGLYAVMDGMSALAIGALVWFAALQIGDPESAVTFGLLVAFIDYVSRIFVPIREFTGRIATLQRAIAALERIFGLLDSDDRIAPGHIKADQLGALVNSADPDGPRTGRLSGHVRFDDVSFAYADDRPTVLQSVGFEVQAGEVVALVGATGSGKTTVGKVLTRMYDGYTGSIQLDGHELRDIDSATVRDQINVVHQDVYLFDGTIHENIRLWSDAVDDAAVTKALALSRAEHFVRELPNGADTVLTERGGNLSTGQRQLLAIARAMARKAQIVILDEATASVDSVTEKLIDEATAILFADRTVLVIAHRLSTIQKADRILVLDHGQVVEQGSHSELMALDGRYKLLVETGFAL
ncbi:MAG: ATP-binding cassette subfamily B multidrug efflux pump [Myxococcota bacterium]|jgi:ATP-binding cassette subfamily B multidrug efflux pump